MQRVCCQIGYGLGVHACGLKPPWMYDEVASIGYDLWGKNIQGVGDGILRLLEKEGVPHGGLPPVKPNP